MTASHLNHPTLIGTLAPWILGASAVLSLWYLLRGRKLEPESGLRRAAEATSFFLILFIVLAAGIVLTRQATGPWHVLLLWPLPSILAICLLVAATQLSVVSLKRAATVVVGVALAALLVSQVRTTAAYVDAYRNSRQQWSSPWSTEIYAAARTISRSAPGAQSIVTADWGLGTEIFALGDEAVRDRFNDAWATFTSPSATVALLDREYFQGRRVIVIYHSRANQIMPSTTQRVEEIIKGFGAHAHPIFVGRQIEAEEVGP
jgi:hypothetical protein